MTLPMEWHWACHSSSNSYPRHSSNLMPHGRGRALWLRVRRDCSASPRPHLMRQAHALLMVCPPMGLLSSPRERQAYCCIADSASCRRELSVLGDDSPKEAAAAAAALTTAALWLTPRAVLLALSFGLSQPSQPFCPQTHRSLPSSGSRTSLPS